MNFLKYICIAFILIFVACHKPDEAITLKPTAQNVKVGSVNMGSNYTSQIYYKLDDGTTQQNDFLIWDLSFECAPNGNQILINGGKEVQIFNTKDTAFYTTTKIPNNVKWAWDNPHGVIDSNAFMQYYDTTTKTCSKFVYLVDRGLNEPERYKKIVINAIDKNRYQVTFSNLDNTSLFFTEIYKEANKNYVYLNLSNAAVLSLEPKQLEWDILFTRYRHVYYDMTPITPYSVTGILLNPLNTFAFRDSVMGFENIDINFALNQTYTKQIDIIGFDWKIYDFALGRYAVKNNITYIINSNNGFYYKLKFIDFYDEQGLKGAPKFQIQKL